MKSTYYEDIITINNLGMNIVEEKTDNKINFPNINVKVNSIIEPYKETKANAIESEVCLLMYKFKLKNLFIYDILKFAVSIKYKGNYTPRTLYVDRLN